MTPLEKFKAERDELANEYSKYTFTNWDSGDVKIAYSLKLREPYLDGFNAALRSTAVRELVDYFAFTLGCAKNLLRPDRPVHKGLDPTFYQTLTYEGDLDLINKCKRAETALTNFDEILTGLEAE